MKMFKRVTALLLALLIGCTAGYGDALAAFVQDSSAYVAEEAVLPEEEETGTEEADAELESSGTEEPEPVMEESGTEEPEPAEEESEAEETKTDAPLDEGTETEDSEAVSTEEVTAVSEEMQKETDGEALTAGLVNFLVVQEPVVTTPGTQRIMVGIGDGTFEVESAVLTYRNQKTKTDYQVKARDVLDDFAVFTMEFKDSSAAGTYRLLELTYTLDGITTTATFAQMGMDVSFGVDQEADTEPDDVLLTDEELEEFIAATEATVVTMDENTDTQVIEDALEEAGCDVPGAGAPVTFSALAKAASAKGMTSIVVVLDAGHGGSDGGAAHNGIVEKNVNLKIAQYCRNELEEYAGVKVIMTRDSDVYLTLAQRAQVAIDNNADVFVSLHNNSSTSSGPNGANVYYPNNNYNSSVGAIGKSLASIIEDKLTALGLASGGIHIRNSENNTKYPDGSLADYYGVIKRCKENGIPGLIVEHAFVSNASDASNFLSSDAKLKKLGVADATGIAEYYGLKKGVGFMSILPSGSDSLELIWKKGSGVTGYEIHRSTKKDSGFARVAKITSVKTTSWIDTDITPGVTYYYKIRTYTESGSDVTYGSFSAVASGGILGETSIVSVKSKDSKNLVITWNKMDTATGYELNRATSKNGTYTKVATITSGSTTKYTDSSVKAGKLYYYKIRSVGKKDNTTTYGSWSAAVSGRTAKTPGSVKVNPVNGTTLRITWTPDTKASGYVVQRATSSKGTFTKIATIKNGEAGSYDDSGITGGKTYYYRVRAYNYNGDTKGYGSYSSVVSGKTLKGTSITKIEALSAKKQKITWKKTDEATGYQIFQSTSKNGTYKKIKTIKSKNTTSYTVTGLTPGVKYFYKIRTYKKTNGVKGFSDYSTVRGAWVAKAVIKDVSGATGTKIKISWDAVKNADSYVIYRSTSSVGGFKKIGTAKGDATSYTDTKLKMTKQYYYKLEVKMKGYKATGTSGMSKAVGGYPVRQTQITSVERNDTGAPVVQWNKVKNITGYELYRSTEQNGSYTRIATIDDANTAVYTDSTATALTVYWYKIRLVNTYNGKTIYGSYSAPAGLSSPEAPAM